MVTHLGKTNITLLQQLFTYLSGQHLQAESSQQVLGEAKLLRWQQGEVSLTELSSWFEAEIIAEQSNWPVILLADLLLRDLLCSKLEDEQAWPEVRQELLKVWATASAEQQLLLVMTLTSGDLVFCAPFTIIFLLLSLQHSTRPYVDTLLKDRLTVIKIYLQKLQALIPDSNDPSFLKEYWQSLPLNLGLGRGVIHVQKKLDPYTLVANT